VEDGKAREADPQGPGTVLEQIARRGAQQLLAQALEEEVARFLEKHQDKQDETGRRMVVRNGHMPQRELVSGIGPIQIKQPRVDDRKLEALNEPRFSSAILPRYLKRVASVENLIPVLYLKGVSTGDFSEALEAILGPEAPGLSATNIVRLKAHWQQEYQEWCKRDLKGKRYVYFWADGLHVNVRLDDERSCILMIMAANERGDKELLAVSDGFRESTASWREMLLDLKDRGLEVGPQLAVADGALGFWAALREVYPGCQEQTCWFHKAGNVLDKMPKSVQGKAKVMLREMWQAPSRDSALKAYRHFCAAWADKYPKAVECLRKDEEALFRFYDYPAAHWVHLRTSNPIESTYATVRHRTRRTKGCGSRSATLTMVWKLGMEAQKTWRRLTGYQLIALILGGRRFTDGELQDAA
jgi:transposase-like protein